MKYRGRKYSQDRDDTYGLMDGWKGNKKFGAAGSVSASVDLIWAGLGDRELAEEQGGPQWRSQWHTHGQAQKHTHGHKHQTWSPTLKIPSNSCQPLNCQQ